MAKMGGEVCLMADAAAHVLKQSRRIGYVADVIKAKATLQVAEWPAAAREAWVAAKSGEDVQGIVQGLCRFEGGARDR
eukprot:660-Alexandrium_andersonii.AAC.1